MRNKLKLIFYFALLFPFLLFQSCSDNKIEDMVEDENIYGVKDIYIKQNISGISVQRKIIIQAPEQTDIKKYPIVFYFHGNGADAESGFILSDFVRDGEFVGIYPQGYKRSWNLGEEESDADDIEFVNMIVEKLKRYSNLDIDNMFAIGTSNGSAMVNELGIKTDHFNGIATLSSQLLTKQIPTSSTNPISVYQICGSNDEMVPYEGGISKVGHIFKSAHESANDWAKAFNCNLNYSVEMMGIDSVFTYNNCIGENIIKFKRIENGDHGLNGKHRERHIMIWEFFKKFI